jgi:hypothetical protein
MNDAPVKSVCRPSTISPKSIASSARRTSDALTDLCCFWFAISCALHGQHISTRSVREEKRRHPRCSEVVDEDGRALDERGDNLLLHLHVFRELRKACLSRHPCSISRRRTPDLAMRVTSARGSSKASMPSNDAVTCCCC